MKIRNVRSKLFEPVDIASLIYFRIVFGIIALWEIWRFVDHGFIERYFIRPAFHFHYTGFDWVRPLAGDGMYWHFAVLGVLALCIIVGFCYRFAISLFFLGFTYVFLLEKAIYLNHLYLFCLLSFLSIFLPLNRRLSIDARIRPQIRTDYAPAWTLWLLRAQMGIVYFYAGLAKLNWDWLHGWPLRIWLPRSSDMPILGQFFDQVWMALLFSYSGLLLDLLIAPLLLWRRTRLYAFGAITLFHLINVQLFDIGIFPWMSIAVTALFFPPGWPRNIVCWAKKEPPRLEKMAEQHLTTSTRRWTTILLAVYLTLQLLVPLRHWLYPGNISWSEEGHTFSWHMKLRDKTGTATFYVKDPESNQVWEVDPRSYLTSRQNRKMTTRPDMALQFAHYLARIYEQKYNRKMEVRAEITASLNGRKPQLIVDPDTDLAREVSALGHDAWITELTEPLRDGK